MRFSEYVAAHPDETDAELAKRAVLDEPEMVIPIIAERIRHERRAPVREVEQEQVRKFLSGPHGWKNLKKDDNYYLSAEKVRETVRRRASFLDDEIALDVDGNKVTWGEATVEQLRSRRSMLASQIAGTRQSMKLVDLAIKRIEEAGVSCLNDIADKVGELAVPA